MSAKLDDFTKQKSRDPVTSKARSSVTSCWIMGFVLLFGAVLLIVEAGTTVNGDGAVFGAIGAATAVVGQALLLIAVVATGVRLGIDGANRSR